MERGGVSEWERVRARERDEMSKASLALHPHKEHTHSDLQLEPEAALSNPRHTRLPSEVWLSGECPQGAVCQLAPGMR